MNDLACCARELGHDGPCEWVCHECDGYGCCVMCGGTGGPDDVVYCEWCDGAGSCPGGCFEGRLTDD